MIRYPCQSYAAAFSLIPFLMFALASAPVTAWDGVDVQDASASLTFQLFVDASPTPICWTTWEESVGGGPGIHQSHTEEEEPCTSAWLVHCDDDSISYRGSWAEIEPEMWYWNWQSYSVEVVCRVYMPERTRLLAERSVTGALSIDEHLVWVTPNNAPDLELLGVGTEDAAQIVLESGVYWITLSVNALESTTHYAYSGAVHVWWEDAGPVAGDEFSWGAVKAIYR